MVWLEDPLTGDVPHRGLVEEQDEGQAQELAPQYCAQPVVQLAPDTVVQDPTVVFLLGQAACLLSEVFFPLTQPAGRISVPELVRVRSPLEEEYGTAHKPTHTCTMRMRADTGSSPGSIPDSSSSSSSSSPLLLVECPRELPPEQAAAWARHVLAALQPRLALIATTLPAMNYRGPGSPADEDLVFCLQTAAAAAATGGSSGGSGAARGPLPPPLPEATLVGGLAAALLARCELQQLPATLVVGVQMQQVPDAQFLYCLGRAAQAAMHATTAGSTGSAPDGPTQQQQQQQAKAQLLAALGAAADAVYRSSASSSIFS